MKLKSFENYSNFYSKDPERFKKRVAIASKFEPHSLFEKVSNLDDLSSLDREVPLIMWDNFSFSEINESSGQYLYNRSFLQDPASIVSMMKGEEFIPNAVEGRHSVKSLKFPIIGLGKNGFPVYQEKVLPRGNYEVLSLDGKPVHAIKRVRGISFDADLGRFKWQDQLENILSKIKGLTESNIFIVHLLEKDDRLFLDKIVQEGELNVPQSVKLYERLYESHHATKLPTWFKKHVSENYLKPHYQKMQYEKLLIKPVGVIDYESLI